MATFPDTAPIPVVKAGPGPFPEPPPSPAAWPAGTGPGGVIQSFTKPTGDGMTLQALMQRQKEAAARGAMNMQQPQGTILGGLGQMANAVFAGLEERRAAKDEATGREEIVQAMMGIDPATGMATPEQLATIMRRDPDMGLALYQQAMQARQDAANAEQWTQIPTPAGETGQWYQNQNGETKKVGGGTEAGGPKPSDVNSMRGQVLGDESYKAVASFAPIYNSMLQSAGQNDRTSDLDMVYGLAKGLDPTGVVRGEDAVMIQSNAPGMDLVKNFAETLNANPNARLSPQMRKDIMALAYRRANANYEAYENFAGQMRTIAEESGMKGSHVAPRFPRPVQFGAAPEVDPDDAADDDANYPG